VKLTVLGCAGSFPSADSPCSSYLVEADGFRLVVDLGNGALGALQRYSELYGVDAVLLSHLHPDHWIDLLQYLVARKYARHRKLPVLPVYGPAGLPDRMAAAYGEADPSAGVFSLHRISAGTVHIGPFTVTFGLVNHPVEAYGMRIEHDGRVLTYSGDTGPCEALVELANDADALLCEASFLEGVGNVANLHLTGRQAGEHAEVAGARRLLLTHLVEAWGDERRTLEEARSSYSGPVEVVRSGSHYEF
jgi:ribonuclease BN (tRNA processing enzyme)